jgi:predicted RNase H-like nuclease (RuvC/YqgF family)
MIAASPNNMLGSKFRETGSLDMRDPADDNRSFDGASSDGQSNEDPDDARRRSKREAIRARLRDSEKKLLKFTSSGDGGGGFLGQMASVQADLKKVAEEKTALESELTKLRDSTGEDTFLNEKMAGIQEGFDKQVEKIRSLREEVVSKDDEVERLHEELIEKLRRVVELEFDLETHEVHYTNYGTWNCVDSHTINVFISNLLYFLSNSTRTIQAR